MSLSSGKPRLSRRMIFLFRVLFTICLMGTVVFIFSNSAQAGELSGSKSEKATLMLNGFLDWLGVNMRLTEHNVRKLAHFSEYALLGFWLMLTLRVYTRRILSFIAWPLFVGLLTAVTDEFFQLFVPERSGQVKDVVIDFGGVMAGLLCGLFVLLLAAAVWDARHGKR